MAYKIVLNRFIDQILPAALNIPILMPFQIKKKVKNIIDFAYLTYKKNYNRAHQQLFLEVNDLAFLRLYKGYKIPAIKNIITKLTQQFVGLFWVIEKIGKLAYRLDILLYWKVHLVFTIAQLEPYTIGNLFEKQLPVQLPNLHIK